MKRLLLVLLSLVALSAVLLAVAAVYRLPLTEAALRAWLDGQGWGDVSFEVTHVGLDRLDVESVRLDDGATLTVERVRVFYTPEDLLNGRAQRIEIIAPRLAEVDFTKGTDAPLMSLPALDTLPFDSLLISKADVGLRTPLGPVTVAGEGALTLAHGDSETSLVLDAAVQAPQGEGRVRLEAVGRGADGFTGRAALSEGRIRLPMLTAEGVALVLDFDDITLEPQKITTSGMLYVQTEGFEMHGLSLRDGVLDAPFEAAFGPGEEVRIALAGTVALKADNLALPGGTRITEPLSLTFMPLTPGNGVLTAHRPADGMEGSVRLDATLRAGPNTVEVPRQGALPLMVTMQDIEGRLGAAFATDAPAHVATAVAVGALSDKSEPPLFAPLSLTLETEGPPEALAFTLEARGADGFARMLATGLWPPRRGEGIAVTIPPVSFSEDGPQPHTLFPRLPETTIAAGRLSGTFRLDLLGAKPSMAGETVAQSLTLDLGGVRLEGLDARLRLDEVFPPASPPGQVLNIRRVRTVTPLENVRVVYRLEADAAGHPAMHVAHAEAEVLGGRVSVRDVLVDFSGAEKAFDLAVDGLEVGELLDLLDLEDFSGTGALRGGIPLTISPEGVSVRAGRLRAESGGVLKVRSRQAERMLGGQGEVVEMALRALEDFHYEDLSISIDKETRGRAKVMLSLLGANPAVLDGHPFRFNIALDSNVDELLEALLHGYRIAVGTVR